jgi:hypothetical protein
MIPDVQELLVGKTNLPDLSRQPPEAEALLWCITRCYVPPSFRPSGLKYPPVRQGPMTNIPL